MRAVKQTGPRTVEVVTLPDPEPGPGQVVVAMRAAGLCGSDLHVYRKGPHPPPYSDIPGHEPCGVVETVGAGVTHLAPGDRVTVYHYESCGRCRVCRQGNWMWCVEKQATGWHLPGSCADKLLIAARNCLPLPASLSFTEGALIACGAGTAWSALNKIRPETGDTVVVFGLGPIGLVGIALLRARGVRVVAVGRRAARLRLATEMGAETVLDAATENISEALHRLFPGGEEAGPNLAFETSSAPEAEQQMVDILCQGGRAVVVGIGNQAPAINTESLTGKQLSVHGSYVMNAGEYESLARFMAEQPLNLERIVTHRFRIEDAAEAFRTADTGDCGKVIFEWPDNGVSYD